MSYLWLRRCLMLLDFILFDVRIVGLLSCLLCLVEELCWIKSFNGTLIPHMSPPDHDWLKSILVIEHELEKFSW